MAATRTGRDARNASLAPVGQPVTVNGLITLNDDMPDLIHEF